jgi:iron complex outermembrane receptor protein
MGTYDYGPWEATLSQTFQSHYQDEGNTRTVGAYSLWDLSASYKGLKNWTFSAGIKNLFDRDPPASAQGEAFQVGYDPTYADPRGRFFWGAVKYVFK